MVEQLRRLWGEETGLATVEYALLLCLVAFAGVLAWKRMSWIIRIVVWISAWFVGQHSDW